MFWRKSKSDAATLSRQDTAQQLPPRGLPRRMTEPVGHPDPNPGTTKENALVADRRTTVAIYILCRVLIEVIGQTTLDRVTDDMAKLEEIIFLQLKGAEPDVLASSPLRMANWTLFGQLLGVMSRIDFERVTDRFFVELEKYGNTSSREHEGKMALLVKGMSYIRLKVFMSWPCWRRFADYPSSIQKVFLKNRPSLWFR